MAEKKRQHYVPIFYLRNFSNQNNAKQINIYVISSKKFFKNGPLSTQAYEDYFYGKDGILESALGLVETSASDLIKNIVKTNELPNYLSDEHYILLGFTILLRARTLYKAYEINEFTDKSLKMIYSKDNRFKDHLNKVEIGMNNPAAFAISVSISTIPMAMDLKYKLLINNTKHPFLTSDNPVVYYNKFLEQRKAIGGITGVAVKGLKIFLPLSPSKCLIFYDRGVYKVGNKKDILINLIKKNDIFEINRLQYLNANECLFFNEQLNESYINEIESTNRKYRRGSKIHVHEYEPVEQDVQDELKRSLLHSHIIDIKCNLELSFLKILKKARKYDLGEKAVHMRNEELFHIHTAFMNKVYKGEYEIREFRSFLKSLK